MKVIKAVHMEHGKLVSTFASNKWRKDYAKGVETTPDNGYLFAYPSKNLKQAKHDIGADTSAQFWLADATVVGRTKDTYISIFEEQWFYFWTNFKLCQRLPRADYLLCSSITLVKRIE